LGNTDVLKNSGVVFDPILKARKISEFVRVYLPSRQVGYAMQNLAYATLAALSTQPFWVEMMQILALSASFLKCWA